VAEIMLPSTGHILHAMENGIKKVQEIEQRKLEEKEESR